MGHMDGLLLDLVERGEDIGISPVVWLPMKGVDRRIQRFDGSIGGCVVRQIIVNPLAVLHPDDGDIYLIVGKVGIVYQL